MPENRYLDAFTDNISEADFALEADMKRVILEKTYKKIRKNKWDYFKSIAAACVLLAALSAFVPNSPVNALCKRIFSFIPGVGIVQDTDGVNPIKAVLNEPVKAIDGDEFVEIKTAYITDNILHVSIKTNVGAINAGKFDDPAEFKKFFAGETAPDLYLIGFKGKIKSGHSVWSGPSFETRVYSIDASFILADEDINNQVFKFEMDGFDQSIEIAMSSVNSGIEPESIGNVAVIDNIMIFANINRENGILEVLLSSVAPEEFKNIRFHLYDHEAQLFDKGIYIADADGNIYKPDDELREKRNSDIDILYFNIPDQADDLKLIVPQILYSKRNYENGIKISMPKIGLERRINKKFQKGYSITTFDGLTSTKKILIKFDVEYAMTGPWVISLK
ncbi:MAG: hypothetical protein GX625_07800 [Clostridiaceae bacterium]|nr:hypothetical protein [Clostridiaceae bacterium]